MRHALIACINGENLMDYFVSEILKEECTIIQWCSHPEYLSASGNIRKTKDGFVVRGLVSYRGSGEKLVLVLNKFGETVKSRITTYDEQGSHVYTSTDLQSW